jgi:hypothetical protein
MGLLDRIKGVVSSTDWPGHAQWIPAANVRPAPAPAPPPFVADATYLRWFLAEGRLEHSRNWFTEWHPAVHAAVSRQFGNTVDEHVTVVSPGAIPGFEKAAAASVTVNKPLTPLLPFPGGSVAVNVGLVGVRGDNAVRTLIDVLGSFGGVITSAALTTGLDVAGKVVDGFEKLLGLGDTDVALAYDSTLSAAGGGAPANLAPGYLAVLDSGQPAGTMLGVEQGRLAAWRDQGWREIQGGFLLLRLESRVERDDWRYLTDIEEPLRAALAEADTDARRVHYQRAIVAARTSRDLHLADRIRIAAALKDQRDTDAGYGAVAGAPDTLEALAAGAPLSVEDALTLRPSLAAQLA